MSDSQPSSRSRRHIADPPKRILICLGPCHGEFYLPLDVGEDIVCPNDRTHPVALYQNPGIHQGDNGSTTVQINATASTTEPCPDPEDNDDFWIDDRPIIGYCSECGEAREDDYTCRHGGSTVAYRKEPDS